MVIGGLAASGYARRALDGLHGIYFIGGEGVYDIQYQKP